MPKIPIRPLFPPTAAAFKRSEDLANAASVQNAASDPAQNAAQSPRPASAPASAEQSSIQALAPIKRPSAKQKPSGLLPLNKLLKQLKLQYLSDLLLLMPKKFSDYCLRSTPELNRRQAAKLRVQSVYMRQSRMICQCYCEHWQIPVMAVFFYPKADVRRAFVVGREVLVYGKLSEYSGLAQFSGPEIIDPSAQLEVDFRARGVSNEQIMAAKAAYLTPEQLRQDGLKPHIANTLLQMNELSEKAAALWQSEELNYALKYAEIFYYQKRLHDAAASAPLRTICELHPLSDWLQSLPFKATQHQLDAIADIRADLQKARHKERVVMGDVGCGKSLVMFAAALSAYPKRSVLMAPTSVLAAQLAAEAQRLLPEYFKTYLLQSAAKTTKAAKEQQREQINAAHLIISTHAALHNDLGELALVMIDEQQRFSTRQRAALGASEGAHYLEFSATPIPRTTAMINGGLYAYSFIRQVPFKKQVQTICIPAAHGKAVMDKIHSEIALGHQAIVVYPLIERGKNSQYMPLNDALDYYKRNFSNVYATHGKDTNKEATLAEFAERGNVLLSTTVIEVGISLPRLSVMVIVAPERYGLATLHQLRGRLGRAGLPGWCYLLSKNEFSPRLEQFCTTTDGFEIAELDLANRNSGDISAEGQQSGEQFSHFDPAQDVGIYEQAKSDIIATFGDFAL